jgi:hypothetical protein
MSRRLLKRADRAGGNADRLQAQARAVIDARGRWTPFVPNRADRRRLIAKGKKR